MVSRPLEREIALEKNDLKKTYVFSYKEYESVIKNMVSH